MSTDTTTLDQTDTPAPGSPEPTGSAAYNGPLPAALRGRSEFGAEISTGFRYDTDANQAADTLIPTQISPTTVPLSLQAQPDWSVLTKVTLAHRYHFFSGVVWETNADVSDQRFLHINHHFDLTVAQSDSGPRIPLAAIGQAKLSVRPFASAAWIGYGEQTYASLYGGGLSVDLLAQRWSLGLLGIGRFGNYQDSAFRPGTRTLTGPEWLMNLSGTFKVDTKTSIQASAFWYQAEARAIAFSRNGPGGSIALQRIIPLGHRAFDLTARGSVQQLQYSGPPVGTQSLTDREDTQWTGNIAVSIPLFQSPTARAWRSLKGVFEYQYFRNSSNADQFADHSITVAVKLTL